MARPTTSIAVAAFAFFAACNNAGDPYDGLPDANVAVHVDASTTIDATRTTGAQEAALVRIDPEAPGSNCPAGGYAVLSGLDVNGDGILENSEVQSTSYICNTPNPTTIEGSVVINNSVDAAKLIGVTMITGSLSINAQGLEDLDLSSLTVIGGDFTADAFSGDTLSAPGLTMVGGSVQIDPADGDTVGDVAFPALTSIGADLAFGPTNNCCQSAAPPVTAADLSSLVTIGGGVTLSTSDLVTLSLPNTTTIGGAFELTGNGDIAITSVSAPSLTSIGGRLDIEAGPAGETLTLAFPLLASIGEDISVQFHNTPPIVVLQTPLLSSIGGSLSLEYDSSFDSVSMPALTSIGSIDIEGEQAMTSISLPALATVNGSITFENNPLLTQLDLSQLSAVAGDFHLGDPCCGQSGNAVFTTLDLPVLTTVQGAFNIGNNPLLATVDAAALQDVGSVSIHSNRDLSDCAMFALATQLGQPSGNVNNNLNDDTACQ